jgi:hypothetical protein
MSGFFLRFEPPKPKFSINHSHKLTFLGSCFSDEMSKYAIESGFDVICNPYGTIYHPISIANNLNDALNGVTQFADIEKEGLFYSWSTSTKINAKSESGLNDLLTNLNRGMLSNLNAPGVLFITFGTAFIYKLKGENKFVANCHKQPGNLFEKENSSTDKIMEIWKETLIKLSKLNPDLKVVFTISPVRHIRDGIIENNQSKARLIYAVEKLTSRQNVDYFPAYEIVMDELRDYRFFKEDRIHPTAEAINFIWKRFSDLYFDEQTKTTIQEFSKIRRRLAHRSDQQLNLDAQTLKSMQHLENEFPWVRWNVEK